MKADPFEKAAILLVLAVVSISATPIGYTLADLGTYGGSTAQATAINASGQATITATNPLGYNRAFFGGMDLTPAGAGEASASGVNGSGQVSGTTYSGGVSRATLWTGGTASFLTAGSYGMAINDSGQMTGMAVGAGGEGHAFLSTAGLMTDLGVLPGGTWSSGYAVNSGGQVVGYGDSGSGGFGAFSWTAAAGLTSLGTLGGANSYATAVNDSGLIAGSAQLRSGYLHAFAGSGSSLLDLGTLGGTSSYGYGVNNTGSVVGYSTMADGTNHAFIYDSGQMTDLNTLLTVSGWVLTEAYAINDSGQIAGAGLFNGVEHAFELNPIVPSVRFARLAAPMVSNPEPSSAVLVVIGAAAILAGRLRRRKV